jgi:hypothetical protein
MLLMTFEGNDAPYDYYVKNVHYYYTSKDTSTTIWLLSTILNNSGQRGMLLVTFEDNDAT